MNPHFCRFWVAFLDFHQYRDNRVSSIISRNNHCYGDCACHREPQISLLTASAWVLVVRWGYVFLAGELSNTRICPLQLKMHKLVHSKLAPRFPAVETRSSALFRSGERNNK